MLGSYTQSKYAGFTEGITFKYNKNKLSFYSSVFHNDGNMYSRIEESKIYYSDKFYHSLSKMKYQFRGNINTNLGLDYVLTEKLSLGFQYLYNERKLAIDDDNDTKIYGLPNYLIQTFSDRASKNQGNNLNFHFLYKLDSLGRTIELNVDYFLYDTKRASLSDTKEYENFTDYIEDSYLLVNDKVESKISNFSTKVDVTHPFKLVNLSYGGKFSFTKNNSNLNYHNLTTGESIIDATKSNTFEYKEEMQSLYTSVNKKLGKWETQFGLRMENTQTKGTSLTLKETYKKDYLKLFPTFYLQYILNSKHNFSFNYSRRISRPYFTSLNPFVRYINPYSTSEGNPFLRPSYSHNFEVSYTFKDNWNNTLYLSTSKDLDDQVESILEGNIITKTKMMNAYDLLTIGLSESYTFKRWKFLQSVNSFHVYYNKVTSLFPEHISDYDGASATFSTNNNFTINQQKTLFFSVNYRLQLPNYEGPYKKKTVSNFGLGLRSLLLDKKLSVNLYADDVFRTLKPQNTSYYNNN